MHGDDEAVIAIAPPGLQQGTLPRNILKQVLAWVASRQAELLANWQLVQSGQPLNPVPPPP
jgi:hypothetical protein